MPIRITRVYTRTGDAGTTALVGGRRVPKDSQRIAAYGTIDELNASLGLARVFNEERLAEGEGHQWLDGVLRRLQNELFDLGSELATPEDAVYEVVVSELLPVAATLLEDEKTEVRHTAVTAMARLSEYVREEDLGQHVLTVILRLALQRTRSQSPRTPH